MIAKLKAALLITTAGVLVMPTSGFAQDTAEAEGSRNVIIVSAQKRDENLQEVPLAITAIAGDVLEDRGIEDITDLDTSVPGLTVGKSGSDARPSIRGVRTEEVDVFNDPVIGFFVDGAYKARTSQALAAFVDLERVEVLRGPQGTLFGRNTYGGSVSVITKKPEFDFGVEGSVSYGNYDDLRLEAVLNAPLSDNTAVRLVGAFERSDGWVNVLPSRDPNAPTASDFNDNDQVYVRGSFRHESGPLDINLMLSHWDQSGFGAGGYGYTVVGTLRNAAGATDLGGTLDRNNPRARSFNGPSDEDPYNVYRSTSNDRDVDETFGVLNVGLDLGGVTLRSITSYSDFTAARRGDEDFSDSSIGSVFDLINDSETFTQEVQLVSQSGGPLQWVVGAYYFSEKGREDFIFLNEANGSIFDFQKDVETDSYAAFAQIDYSFSDAFKLTLGARYTDDQKDFSYRNDLNSANPDFEFSRSDDKITWRVGAEFNPTPDNMIYAMVSTGFRSGGANNPNANVPNPVYGAQTITAYEIGSKNTIANGAGILNISAFYNDMDDILANTFVAIGPTQVVTRSNAGKARAYGAEVEFLYDFDNGLVIDANAAYLNAKFTDFIAANPFSTNSGPLPTDPATGQLVLDGNEIPLSPDFTLTLGARYEIELPGGATLTPGARFYWSDSYFVNEFNYDGARDGREVGRQSSFTKTDATLTFETANDAIMIQAFVRNLEDKAVLNRSVVAGQAAIYQNYAPPRTYGVRVGFKY